MLTKNTNSDNSQYIFETKKPSEEKAWLKHYKNGAFERANNIPQGVTLWDVLEEKLLEFSDVPALEYFKKKISRTDFIRSVYTWAKAFKAMGVEENDIVPIYGPFVPEVCAMTCALNIIGAVAYFLKLSISENALEEETTDAKIAIIFDGMWKNVKTVFSSDRFERIIFTTITDEMPMPQKLIISLLTRNNKNLFPHTSKYIWAKDAKKKADNYIGNVKVPFVPNRSAFITSSSGSTGGAVKGIIVSNESAIAQLLQGLNADVNYFSEKKCFTNLPPTASTSLNALFFLPLYHGMTCLIDPRFGEEIFYDQIMKSKTSVSIAAVSFWEAFFKRVEREIDKGNAPDLSFADMFIIGGEGPTPDDKKRFDRLMHQCGSEYPTFSGCGLSEMFSVISVEKTGIELSAPKIERPVITVGIPYPGIIVGVFNEKGEELGYNERGELWVKGKSMMKGYYRKPELTTKTIDQNGWLHTGDLYDIDEDGLLYIWGRLSDKTTLPDGTDVQLFDIAYKIRNDEAIKYAFVNAMPLENGEDALVAHVVFNDSFIGNKKDIYQRIDNMLYGALPNISIAGYKAHEIIKASPTTAKKDREGLMNDHEGYEKSIGNKTVPLSIRYSEATGKYTLHYS